MANPEPVDLLISPLTNGQYRELRVPPWLMLLDLLHERLDLVGSKKGYDHGQCGACTVLRNGHRTNACLTLAVMCDSDALTTTEGLAEGDCLHPLQQAFTRHNAFQCGYCMPGQICSVLGLAGEGWVRSWVEIREDMSGNLCRRGAYGNVLDTVEDALPLLDHDGQGGQRT